MPILTVKLIGLSIAIGTIVAILVVRQSPETKGLRACQHAGDLMSRAYNLSEVDYGRGMEACKEEAKIFCRVYGHEACNKHFSCLLQAENVSELNPCDDIR